MLLLSKIVFVIKTCEYCTNISTCYALKNVWYLDSEGNSERGKVENFGSEGKRGKGECEISQNFESIVK